MTTGFFTHPHCLQHDTGPHHPERPARLQAINELLQTDEFKDLKIFDAPQAKIEWLEYIHPKAHIEKILGVIPEMGQRILETDMDWLEAVHLAPEETVVQDEKFHFLDADTTVSKHSFDAALHAAGAVCAAIDAVMAGELKNAFCAVRPPGHHAEPERVMGFCLINNVAIGAEYARRHYGVQKIAIIDFDVHHGNGTQAAFWDDANTLYISTHEGGAYPGHGFEHETGAHNNILNVPLPPGSGSAECRAAYADKIFPRLEQFAPDLILFSAGFDAHYRDPLASLEWTKDDFFWITERTMQIADRVCQGRIVSALEGGYDLIGLKEGVGAHLNALRATV